MKCAEVVPALICPELSPSYTGSLERLMSVHQKPPVNVAAFILRLLSCSISISLTTDGRRGCGYDDGILTLNLSVDKQYH